MVATILVIILVGVSLSGRLLVRRALEQRDRLRKFEEIARLEEDGR